MQKSNIVYNKVKKILIFKIKNIMALTEKWKKLWEEVFEKKHRETMKNMKKIAINIRKSCKD